MIEKLNVAYIQVESDGNAKLELSNKINELVDAVNELTSCVGQLGVEFTDPKVNTVYVDKECYMSDPYAEQRKWIGKLCKVYDDNSLEHYAVLDEICDDSIYCYGTLVGNYQHCEPVKPDDDIIYKGE